jgi:hypothetical protein
MTRSTNARIAGFAFLLYIALGVTSLFLGGTGGEGTAAQLANIARHESAFRAGLLLSPILWFCAIALAVTLYALTRDEDPDLAMLVLVSRAGEGMIGAAATFASLGLLWLATLTGPAAPDAASSQTLGSFLFKVEGWNTTISAIFFAVGSTAFSYLLLRGRMVPVALAWVGVVASALLVVGLPLQLAGYLDGTITNLMWLPMLLFEVPLAFWLIIKGVAPRRTV